jgi:hypothetical protein
MSLSQDELRQSLNQVAKRLHVHVATPWRWALHGVRGRRLKTILIGGRRWVRETDLAEFLAADPATVPASMDRLQRNQIAESKLNAHGVKPR